LVEHAQIRNSTTRISRRYSVKLEHRYLIILKLYVAIVNRVEKTDEIVFLVTNCKNGNNEDKYNIYRVTYIIQHISKDMQSKEEIPVPVAIQSISNIPVPK
jgi:hypothetical protein